MNKFARIALGAAASVLALAARADGTGPDTSAITAAGVTVGTVGAAVFTVMVGIKVIKWVRRAL